MTDANAADSSGWQDQIVSERLTVDRAFQDRVQASSLPNQAWDLVMTAVEFEIEDPEDPEQARIVADTSRLESVLPAMEEVESSMGQRGSSGASGGIIDRIRSLFGGNGAGSHLRQESERLAGEYANQLQEELESTGRWEEIRESAADKTA